MTQHATTTTSASKSSQEDVETDAEFVSEDVYAETRGEFTRVTCHDVYAFASLATSNDFSETVDSVTDMTQVAVEIEFPNGRRELLVFQPRNFLKAPHSHRKALIEALFDNGEVWISEFDSLFSPGMIPKSWDTIVVPDTASADSVLSYRENSILNYGPQTKELLTVLCSGLFLIGVSGAFGMMLGMYTGSMFWTLAPMAGVAGFFHFIDDSIVNYLDNWFEIKSPHLWTQRMDISEEELESCSPASEETVEEIQTAMLGLSEEWTTSTVLNVDETKKTTTLDLLTSSGAEITVEYPTPADNSDRFTLNRIKSSLGVGSVQMLEGEQVEVSLTSLGKEDDVANDGFYRVRPATN